MVRTVGNRAVLVVPEAMQMSAARRRETWKAIGERLMMGITALAQGALTLFSVLSWHCFYDPGRWQFGIRFGEKWPFVPPRSDVRRTFVPFRISKFPSASPRQALNHRPSYSK